MLVGLAIFRRVVVDYTVDALDIDSAGCDIGGDHRTALTLGEKPHRTVTLPLFHATMQNGRAHTGLVKLLTNSFNSSACTTEYDDPTTFSDRFSCDFRFHVISH